MVLVHMPCVALTKECGKVFILVVLKNVYHCCIHKINIQYLTPPNKTCFRSKRLDKLLVVFFINSRPTVKFLLHSSENVCADSAKQTFIRCQFAKNHR